jgi:endoglucanase
MIKNILLFALICLALSQDIVFNQAKAVKDSGKVTFDNSKQSGKLMTEMGLGWNLGNSFDAHNGNGNEGLSSETSWGNPKVTNAMIDKLVAKGFKTIRIPVTWHNHLIDNQYTIDPQWMLRVKTVVDYCIKKGLFVILNVHHDNSDYGVSYRKGYYPRSNQMGESKKFLANIWTQITLAFNNGYDHHLIFECLNEPRLIGDGHEWWYQPGESSSEECVKVINEYNYLIHYIIRNSGGNNKVRFILFTSGAAAFDYVTSSGFYLPDDSKYNPKHKRLLVSVDMYTPYDFAMNADMNKNRFTQEYKNEILSKLNTLKNKFINNGYYVVITEMGATDKGNTDQRIAWGKFYVSSAKNLKIPCVIWDNNIFKNQWDDANEKFGLFHRSQGTFEPDSYVSALIQAAR